VTRDEILDALWGVDYVSESNVVDRRRDPARAVRVAGITAPRSGQVHDGDTGCMLAVEGGLWTCAVAADSYEGGWP
jgi:hypothetical protein